MVRNADTVDDIPVTTGKSEMDASVVSIVSAELHRTETCVQEGVTQYCRQDLMTHKTEQVAN